MRARVKELMLLAGTPYSALCMYDNHYVFSRCTYRVRGASIHGDDKRGLSDPEMMRCC